MRAILRIIAVAFAAAVLIVVVALFGCQTETTPKIEPPPPVRY